MSLSLALVFAWDLEPIIPPPHFFLFSSNLSLKLAWKIEGKKRTEKVSFIELSEYVKQKMNNQIASLNYLDGF